MYGRGLGRLTSQGFHLKDLPTAYLSLCWLTEWRTHRIQTNLKMLESCPNFSWARNFLTLPLFPSISALWRTFLSLSSSAFPFRCILLKEKEAGKRATTLCSNRSVDQLSQLISKHQFSLADIECSSPSLWTTSPFLALLLSAHIDLGTYYCTWTSKAQVDTSSCHSGKKTVLQKVPVWCVGVLRTSQNTTTACFH